jgi:mitochondrial fission protein ELM1
MISDTISSGKPVYIQEIDSVKRKIRYFIQILQKHGFVRYYSGKLDIWRYKPLNESLRVSKIIERLI